MDEVENQSFHYVQNNIYLILVQNTLKYTLLVRVKRKPKINIHLIPLLR